ncbi:VOC family protein [Levilactobacillus bambusae]|uniref:VOC family protein n=1 Tax=Levilactobacillus bambusae TaxID=2024736 RepID=A0A2V1N1P7_9LACO|nr:hypothetical protein [Levilactobacillus bambusae]PWG00210.1 hypothetical protein DCM90_04555 [Levilactobacillus bambusae]
MNRITTPMIYFDGDARDAISFYMSALDFQMVFIETFSNYHFHDPSFPLNPADRNKIAYAVLTADGNSGNGDGIIVADRTIDEGLEDGSGAVELNLQVNNRREVLHIENKFLADDRTQIIDDLYPTAYSSSIVRLMDPFGITWRIMSNDRVSPFNWFAGSNRRPKNKP